MATASKKSPGDQSEYGGAQRAPGVRSVSNDDNDDEGVKSNVITPQSSPTRANKSGRAPAVLDRWFDAQLGRLYADVASEPVPVEMLQLIAKLKKSKQPGS